MDEIQTVIQAKIHECAFQNRLTHKRIFLFGYIAYTQSINNFLHEEGYRLHGIIDNDRRKQGMIIIDIPIIAPESVDWSAYDIVLIASAHEKSMKEQMHRLSENVEIVVLVDIERRDKCIEKKEKFWLHENYKLQVEKLRQGSDIYKRLKRKEALIVFLPGLGDTFCGGLYLHEYERKINPRLIKVVVSQSAYKVAQLLGIENIVVVSKQEMDLLFRYMVFHREEEDMVGSSIHVLDLMAGYKKITFPMFWGKYFFRLGSDYEVCFPSIWDNALSEQELQSKGIVKGKTVVLAPYANTCDLLPFQFWEMLTEELIKLGYYVFTNTISSQKPIRNSSRLEIPLSQVGNYLEFAGYFISLRSGLCDVAGRSRCKQIIIFRDKKAGPYMSEIELYDLHCEGISEHPVQYLYDDNDLYKNINEIINALTK